MRKQTLVTRINRVMEIKHWQKVRNGLRMIACIGLILAIWLPSTLAIAAPVESNLTILAAATVQDRNTYKDIDRDTSRSELETTNKTKNQWTDSKEINNKTEQRQTSRVSNASLRATMPPDIQRILARGKLIVAILDQDNPPFFMTSRQGLFTGLDVKLAQAIAEQLGVKLEFNRTAKTFDAVVQMVDQLNADLAISKLSRTMNRAKSICFTNPYLRMRQGLLVNRLQIAQQANGRSMTEVIRNLEGKVGVIRGSSYVGFTQKKFPKATIVEFPSWAEAINAVIRGDVLATYRDELEIKKIVLSKPDTVLNFQTIALTDTQDSIAIALPWDSQHLLAFVNQYLDMTNINYTADSLLEEYANSISSF